MRSNSLISTLVLFVGALAGVSDASADVIYQNDFGTTEQVKGFQLSAYSGLPFATDVVVVENPPVYGTWTDLDGDGQVANLRLDGGFVGAALQREFLAPNFKTFSDISFSAYVGGDITNYSAMGRVDLSADGVNYGYLTQAGVAGQATLITSAPGSDPAYSGLKSVWGRLAMLNASGQATASDGHPRAGSVTLSSTLNDPAVGERVWIYRNDFGTQEQVNEFTITGTSDFLLEAGAPDTDYDNLGNTLSGNTGAPYSSEMLVRIDAPSGKYFSNPTITAVAGGNLASWGSGVRIELSTDGTNFSQVSAQTGSGNSYYLLSADGTGIAGFEDLSTVWAKVTLFAGNFGGSRPFIYDLRVSGDIAAVPEPTVSVMMLAAGAMLLRRRAR